MEPRGAVGHVDKDGRPTLHVSYQSPHNLRDALANMFGMEKTALRVVATDVGGSFGMKSGLLREEFDRVLGREEAEAAGEMGSGPDRRRSCPTNTRATSRSMLRSASTSAGISRHLRVGYRVNIGAYLSARSASPIGNFGGIAGVYRTPKILGQATGIFTHTTPTAPYRGAGRPDATYAIERLIDVAAQEMNIDPFELRKRNLIPPSAMPYKTPFVFTYDCGDFIKGMDKAAELAALQGLRRAAQGSEEARQAARHRHRQPDRSRGRPVRAAEHGLRLDRSEGRRQRDGCAPARCRSGRGSRHRYPTSSRNGLSVPIEKIDYVYGDTDKVPRGKGNGGSAALTLRRLRDLASASTSCWSRAGNLRPIDSKRRLRTSSFRKGAFASPAPTARSRSPMSRRCPATKMD